VVDKAHIDKAISAFPELAAALSEYIRDPNRPEGLYGFCDIGGGTIDGAIFRLNRGAGYPRLAIPSAAVRPLGTVAVARDLVRRAGTALSAERQLSLSQQVDLMLFDAKPTTVSGAHTRGPPRNTT
jgi:hypothetical protein